MGIFDKFKTALANKLSDFVANNADKTDESTKSNENGEADGILQTIGKTIQKVKSSKASVETKEISAMEYELQNELQKCQDYAAQGYQLANKQYKELLDTLEKEEKRIKAANDEQNQMKRVKNTELIEEQQQGLKELTNYIYKIQDDIKMLRERQKDFSIVVYGRTMAGKSTLMEILTHGNGKSIGKGAQRTTLDVRSYHWKGLKIVDVPGICSFDGREDDKLAFEEAKSADLILFLLTDNAPEADEAEALAQLKSLGKPVLGIINVKMSFNINEKDLDLPDLQDKLSDTTRIDNICEQFKEFAKLHNQNWDDIPFVHTHLNAAFQAQPERGNDDEVYKASNFPKVEEYILDKVRNDGKFLRLKNFIDIVAVPMQQVIDIIYTHSIDSLNESYIYDDKIGQLYKWKEGFIERTQKRLDSFFDDIEAQIDKEIMDFVEYNYENKNAGQDWENRINQMDLPKRYQDLMQEFANECDRKRKELSDELTQELKLSFHSNTQTNVEMDGTTPWAQYAALVLPNFLMFVPGIGWGARIAIGIGSAIFSFLFENKEEKIRENKQKLLEALYEPSHKMHYELFDKVVEVLNNEIADKGINGFANILADMTYMLARLAKVQSDMASALKDNFYALNEKLINEAIKYKGRKGSNVGFKNIARIPGQEILIMSDDWNRETKDIESLIGENIEVITYNEDVPAFYKSILHKDVETRSWNLSADENPEKIYFMTIDKDVDPSKLILAQQFAVVPIIPI